MSKKDTDNFDFEVEGEGKEKGGLRLNLDFIKNLTKQQKGIILAALVGIILVVAIIVVVVIVGAGSGGNTSGGNTNPGGDNSQTGTGNGESILPEDVVEFYIATLPDKNTYYVGDEADYSGLSVYVRSASLGSVTIKYEDAPDKFKFTGFNNTQACDELAITVEYAGSTTTFTVKMLEHSIAQSTLVGITVNPLPKTTYKVGKSFNPTGGYIVAEYSDGTTESIELTLAHISGYGAIAYIPGEHQIKVKYADDHGGYAETTLTITITE